MLDSREIKKVMISSTSLDLPQHRAQVVEACLRLGLFPIDMKHLPARDITPLAVDQEMIDAADVYIGIYAFRYGSVAEGEKKSYTELEFDRADARGIPCLIFLMSAEHRVLPGDVESTPGVQEKLTAFKARASKGRICKVFQSAEDLRFEVLHALSKWKLEQRRESGEKPAPSFHPPSHIPQAPKPYVAHPYVLLQTKNVIGRRAELEELSDWITKNEKVPAETRILSVVAIGGMGKSALTWKWFEDIAPKELPTLAGRMWWSFYESDAHWENFLIRALAYTAGMAEVEARQLPSSEREDLLLRLLDEQSFLIVLDGLERILLAYARMDAARLPDDNLDQQTANIIGSTSGLSNDLRETYLEKHRLRQCADLRAGAFLLKLTRVHASRVLISTRLCPAELQTQAAQLLPGCHALLLRGLTDNDCLKLWRASGVDGSPPVLLPLFNAFDNYPLLLRALAGEVAQYRKGPGKFDAWRKEHPNFNPAVLPLKQAKTHVLEFALRGLEVAQGRVLNTIAGFRMPASWDTLQAVLSSGGARHIEERTLDRVLSELENRGLVGWDKAANRYDLHPIVRAVVWKALDSKAKRDVYQALHNYFNGVPRPGDWRKVESVEILTPVLELFDKLIGLERYDEAYLIYREHISRATGYRLSANRLRAELLEQLFVDGTNAPPKIEGLRNQGYTMGELAIAYNFSAEPSRALPLYRQVAILDKSEGDLRNFQVGLCNMAEVMWSTGHLSEGENTAKEAILISRQRHVYVEELESLRICGTALAATGKAFSSHVALRRALSIAIGQKLQAFEGVACSRLAQRHLWLNQSELSLAYARKAFKLIRAEHSEGAVARVMRIHGTAALRLGNLAESDEVLREALARARAVSYIEEEQLVLTALAELHQRRKEYDRARELLELVWAPTERGPYPLWHADARNVLAQVERDIGNTDTAIEAATVAHRLAWCDGPPYAYHYGLTNARRHLQELGAPEPELPPFDETKFPSMLDVELNPKDDYWVDLEKLDDS